MLNKLNYYNKTYRENDKLVLIHQMGKVGSTSVTKSLKRDGFSPIHIHSFFSPLSSDMYKKYESIRYYRSPLYNKKYFLRNQFILKLLKNRKKLKIISLVREPISRNVSMYFQAFHVPLMDINSSTDNRVEANTNTEAFRKDFFTKFNHEYGVKWFDEEFKRAWKINVYDYPFNQEEGYTIIKKGNLEILLLKMEKLNELEEVIGNFVEKDSFALKSENMGGKKWYHSFYKEFKNNMTFSREYIYKLYNTKFMKHFYSEQERAEFRNKFEK